MHNIKKEDTMYSTDTTWHGLETIIETITKEEIPNVLHPVKEFKIDPSCLTDEDGNELDSTMLEGLDMEDWKIIVADLRDNPKAGKMLPLHIPKQGYKIHQNEELFDSMNAGCKEVFGNEYEIKTVGTLGGYKSFIMSIYLKQFEGFSIGENDKHDQFFNLTTSHNGSLASAIMLSVIRIVCENTAQFALEQSEANGTQQKIKHSAHSEINAKWIEDNLKKWIEKADDYKTTLARLKNEKMNIDQFRIFSSGVFSDAKSDKLSSQAFNRINAMESLFVRGKGNVGETKLDAYNAFTEYFTHHDGQGDKSKRLAKGSFGRGNDWKQEVFRALKQQEHFPALMKRGETLYNDKLTFEIGKSKLN